LAYTEPALQQIPSRNKRVAAIVKPAFLPDEDHDWLSLDMNSFEVRVFAHLINNPEIIAAYLANPLLDLHQFVAELTGLVRNATYSGQPNAKQLNLSMIFNSGNGAIAEKMGMPWEWASFKDRNDKKVTYKKAGEAAEAVIQQYHARIPGVKELASRAKEIAEAHGYVQTKHGRRLRFPRKFKTYKASGLAIQATAADINKEMWLLCDRMESDTGNHLIMNTHDSYEINVAKGTDPVKLRDILQDQIRAQVPWFRVPLVLDLNGIGSNYWSAING
jgi:DNA polymerase I-like protein with 3'-5' exonuclease and polymerase domains